MRRPRPAVALLSVALTPALAGVVVALPVVTPPRPQPHAVAPVVRTIDVTGTATTAAARVLGRAALRDRSFSVVGARWDAGSLAAGDRVEVRVRTGGAWSEWTALEPTDGGPDAGSPDARRARRLVGHTVVTEPLWVGSADDVEARVAGGGEAPTDLQLTLVDPGTSDADAHPGPATPIGGASAYAEADQPDIRTRQDWGADESLRKHACPDGPDYNSTVKVGFIHHTDTANDYSRSDVPRILRGIYAYHVKGNGWCDVGYNYLVDKFGRIWEGRYGGIDKAVLGAHTGGFNVNSFGASMIGTFTSHRPPSALLAAVKQLFAWKLGRYYRDPTSTNKLTSAGGGTSKYAAGTVVRFNVVSGHRDAGNTTCPGDKMYAKLAAIRLATHELIGSSFLNPKVRPKTDASLGAGNVIVRAGALLPMRWTLTVTASAGGTVVRTETGHAAPDEPIATGWDRRDDTGAPVAPGKYVVALTGSSAGIPARPYQRTVTLTEAAPPHPVADVIGNGWSSLVVGAPGRRVAGMKRAGALVVQPSSATGPATTGGVVLSQETPGVPGGAEIGDALGAATAAGDFDGDGFADVAAGAPGEDIGSDADAGGVTVFRGGPDGPRPKGSVMLTKATTGVRGAVHAGDRFGAVLAAADLNRDGYADLVVGSPGDTVHGQAGAGALTVFPGSVDGLDAAGAIRLSESASGVPRKAAAGDAFATALTVGDLTGDGFADVIAGAPGASVGGEPSGAIYVLPGSASGPSGLGATAVTGTSVGNAGGFGSALAVGRFSGRRSAASLAVSGASGVTVMPGMLTGVDPTSAATWSQDSPGAPGRTEPGDAFGAALTAGDLDGDGFAELVIGVPGEDVGTTIDSGHVVLLFGGESGLSAERARALGPESPDVPGNAEADDRFGSAVSLLALDSHWRPDLAVGVPGETTNGKTASGALVTLRGSPNGVARDGGTYRLLGSAGGGTARAGDAFGAAVAHR